MTNIMDKLGTINDFNQNAMLEIFQAHTSSLCVAGIGLKNTTR